MSLGNCARRLLGPRFHGLARRYRTFFADLEALAEIVAAQLPLDATVLDIGAGDGAVLNYLFARRPDLHVIMLDTGDGVGGAVEARYLGRCTLMPRTALTQYAGSAPDAIIALDVLHHVPTGDRVGFLQQIAALGRRHAARIIIVKEVDPKGWRSCLGWLSDRFITGDRNVRFIPPQSLADQLRAALGNDFAVSETALRTIDAPNYCMTAVRIDRR